MKYILLRIYELYLSKGENVDANPKLGFWTYRNTDIYVEIDTINCWLKGWILAWNMEIEMKL